MARKLGLSDVTVLTKAMTMARGNKNLTVTQALQQLTRNNNNFNTSEAPNSNQASTDTENKETKPTDEIIRASEHQKKLESSFTEDSQEDNAKQNQVTSIEDHIETYEQKIRRRGGYQEGGLVEDELVNQASDDQIAAIQTDNGGRIATTTADDGSHRINVQEVGFVGDKTPEQVTDTQSVADNVPMDVREDDFIINAPAIEKAGVRNVVNMVQRALIDASQAGIEILDLPADIPENELVQIMASESEFRIPKNLIPFIGKNTLTRINDVGKPEVESRSGRLDKEMKNLDEKRPQVQRVRQGGIVKMKRRNL